MKFKDETFPSVSFERLLEQNGLEITIRERPVIGPGRYYAKCDNVEAKDGCFLVGTYGNGATKEEAIRNYSLALLSKKIVIDSWTDHRREIQCPNEWSK